MRLQNEFCLVATLSCQVTTCFWGLIWLMSQPWVSFLLFSAKTYIDMPIPTRLFLLTTTVLFLVCFCCPSGGKPACQECTMAQNVRYFAILAIVSYLSKGKPNTRKMQYFGGMECMKMFFIEFVKCNTNRWACYILSNFVAFYVFVQNDET